MINTEMGVAGIQPVQAWGDEASALHGDDDDSFEDMLEDFKHKFQMRQDSMDFYTARVVHLLSEALAAANIRHTTISSRIKTWKSAEGSIRRKRNERAMRRQLRDTVESQKQDWNTYCSYSNLGSGEIGPFKSADEMLEHLRDFGGARISLYFPGDVERVAQILKGRFKVDSETRKHQSMDVKMDLQRRLEGLDPNSSPNTTYLERTERSFPGYKATHFCVRLLGRDIPCDRMCSWKDLVVEIQVGTLVMHAWSEIEHDMIYKPLETNAISKEEVQLLDLINGIVATGESALQQLEWCMERRRSQRAKDEKALAMSHHELGHWLEKYWVKANHVKIEGDWEYLTQSYAIVKATGDHQLGKVQQIFGSIDAKGILHRKMLIIKILVAMCQPLEQPPEEPRYSRSGVLSTFNNARFWATHFIHSLNMAMFLGVASEFLKVKSMPPRPHITDVIDIIHPTLPSCRDMGTVKAIATYCETILRHHEREIHYDHVESKRRSELSQTQLLHIAACLSRTGRITKTSGTSTEVFIPAAIIGLYVESNRTTALSVQKKLSFIEHYVKNRQTNNPDKLAVWDRLKTATSEHSDNDLEEWFLKPTLVTSMDNSLAKTMNKASWKYVARPLHLDAAKLESGTNSCMFARDDASDIDEILKLAYRLHPEQRDLVDLAWGMLESPPTELVEVAVIARFSSLPHWSSRTQSFLI